jgi:hypothetical protein
LGGKEKTAYKEEHTQLSLALSARPKKSIIYKPKSPDSGSFSVSLPAGVKTGSGCVDGNACRQKV